MDVAAIRAWLPRAGRVSLIDLTMLGYGRVGVTGERPLPTRGDPVDPSAPVITGSDVASFGVASDGLVGTVRMDFTQSGSEKMASYSNASAGHYVALTLDGIVLATTAMDGQGRYGTLQMTVSVDDVAGLNWLGEDGNSPLPEPLAERSYSTAVSPASPAPSGPTVAPTPRLDPTPVPATPDAAGTFIVYVVKAGDTLSAIAARFNVSLPSLEAANPQLETSDLILVGSIVNIPPPRPVP